MKKYWIIVEGKPQGPFTAEQLKVRRDFSAALPVWTNELPDWTTAGSIPELAVLLEEETPEAATAEQPEPQPQAASYTPQPDPEPQPQMSWSPTRGMHAAVIDGRKPPKSYIGWNIAMLFCCCLVGGIIGIIFGSQVNSRWERGDVEGAQKASDAAQWCIIISIVAGLVAWPFQLISTLI